MSNERFEEGGQSKEGLSFAGVIESIYGDDNSSPTSFEIAGKQYSPTNPAELAYAAAQGRTKAGRELLAEHQATVN